MGHLEAIGGPATRVLLGWADTKQTGMDGFCVLRIEVSNRWLGESLRLGADILDALVMWVRDGPEGTFAPPQVTLNEDTCWWLEAREGERIILWRKPPKGKETPLYEMSLPQLKVAILRHSLVDVV